MANDEVYKEKDFTGSILPRLYAWCLRRRGYVTKIKVCLDIAPTGLFWSSIIVVTAWKKGIY